MSNLRKSRAWRILNKIYVLEKKAKYEYTKTGSVPKETLLNRCLNHIQTLQNLTSVTASTRQAVLRKAWKAYLGLTEINFPERIDYDARREVSLETLGEDYITIEHELPDIRRGRLGYAQQRLGQTFALSGKPPTQPWGDQYWQPERAKKAARMKSEDFWFGRPEKPNDIEILKEEHISRPQARSDKERM